VFVLPQAGWQRVAVVALLILPLVLVVILMSPALLTWPALSDKKRSDFRELVQKFVDWVQVASGGRAIPSASLVAVIEDAADPPELP
jgi:hypothetical protein